MAPGPGPGPHLPQAPYYGTPTRPPPPPQMQPGSGPPPSAKRYKPSPVPVAPSHAGHAGHASHAAAVQAHASAAMNAVGGDPVMTIDEEEDTSRGDILDHFSPREIAQTRYTQHHEWMEEVIGSAYPISRIVPVDLGLGLSGELSKVTDGLLDLPLVHPPPPLPAPAPMPIPIPSPTTRPGRRPGTSRTCSGSCASASRRS